MSVHDKPRHAVLRGAMTHVQPRRLAHPMRARADVNAASDRAVTVKDATLHRDPTSDDAGYAKGREEGHAAGLEQGLSDAKQRVERAMLAARQEFEQLATRRLQDFGAEATARLSQLERLLAGLEPAVTKRLLELETDAVALAYAAVCRILGEQAVQPQGIARVVRQGIEQLRGSELLEIRMNERDLHALSSEEQGRRLQASVPQVKWVADAGVEAGGCIVETTAGRLDARLDTQLDALRSLWTQPRDEGMATR